MEETQLSNQTSDLETDTPVRVYSRQEGLFNPYDKNNQVPVVVIGAGTIGSWTTLFLAKLGISDITVFDNDRVEIQNIANQLYSPFDATQIYLKTQALQLITYQLTGNSLRTVETSFPVDESLIPPIYPSVPFILIVTVDSMKSRKAIFEWLQANFFKVRFFIDARTGGEVGRVFTFSPFDPMMLDKYKETIHDDTPNPAMSEELRAASNVKCTERSIVDVSVTVASRITNSVRKHITKKVVPFETDIDLRNDIWLSMK
jgi:molybdopterin/thiamine biosynthesis adenylyltransferase